MSSIIVHNISNRHFVPTKSSAITIGHIKIRPGKFAMIPVSSISDKVKKLHGKFIWIGDDLPTKFLVGDKPEVVSALTNEEALEYLKSLSESELRNLNKEITPSFDFAESASKRLMVYKILAACFSSSKILNPESFFWLGRWTKDSSGDYIEV